MKGNQIVLPPDAEGGVSITPPKGCEVDKVEVVDGILTVTFKPQKRRLPKSWEEFCEMYNFAGEYFIEPEIEKKNGQVLEMTESEKRTYRNAELLPDRATAEAVLALCQLIQLRNAYNGYWVPDWTKNYKYVIEIAKDGFISGYRQNTPTILYFKTEELRDEFLRNFRPLIEKLKPLYGIKEGGEE